MKRLLYVILLVICFHAIGAEAANWYVRPSGGSGSGTSWTSSWNEMNGINWSTVSCGDTIWVAGGTYGQQLLPIKNCTSGAQLYIRRARSDAFACTGAAGWSSGYDSTVVQTATYHPIEFAAGQTNNYITISGRTTASGGGYGWKITMPTGSQYSGIYYGGNGSVQNYITLEYIEVAGPDNPQSASGCQTAGACVAIENIPYNSSGVNSTYHTLSHMSIHGWVAGIFNQYQTNALYEYIDMYNIYAANSGLNHPDLMYIADGSYGTIRYSKFHDACSGGSGIFFTVAGSTNYWNLYGNMFYDMTSADGNCYAVKLREGTVLGLKIFNNTFSNNDADLTVSDGVCGTGCETKNNIFHGTGWTSTYGTQSNNLVTTDSSIFTNYAAKDYHIVSTVGSGYPRNAGTSLSSYFTTDAGTSLSSSFTTDMDRNTFGADGTPDLGAYEYNPGGGGGSFIKPSAPMKLSVF